MWKDLSEVDRTDHTLVFLKLLRNSIVKKVKQETE